MKKSISKVLAGVALVGVLCSSLGVASAPASAAVAPAADQTTEEGMVSAQVVLPKEVIFDNVASLLAASNGEVEGDGVRLRAKPNSSATVLELMYDREKVYIDYSETYANWYSLRRNLTGTWGYANKSYIYIY